MKCLSGVADMVELMDHHSLCLSSTMGIFPEGNPVAWWQLLPRPDSVHPGGSGSEVGFSGNMG